jgi:cyclophilin family peptidyl-prolyl cis-trans isomerase
MKSNPPPASPKRPASWAAALAGLLLAACGGGSGSGSDGSNAAVSASSVTTVRYGETMTVTLVGTGLDGALALSSPGCRSFARSTTAPFVSSATTAYYTCTVSGATGDQVVTVSAGGTVLAQVPFNTPVPQVTMLLSNGAAVNGTLVITLNPAAAPVTVDNFLAYVRSGFYNGTVFHRHAPNFVLQGGGFAAPLTAGGSIPVPKPTQSPIVLEVGRGLSNTALSVAMARTNEPNSATSQFFINLVNNPALDTASGGYAVFGQVTAGAEVITASRNAPCLAWSGFLPSGDCLPSPNIIISTASQTR